MIADLPEQHASVQTPPFMTPGHTFKDGGREMIVVKSEGGDLIDVEVVRRIDPGLIDPHPKNRKWCDPAGLAELVENIRENGQSTPGILRPHPTVPGRYELVAAWRRWQACTQLNRPLQAVVRDLDDAQALEQLYLENAQRENLRPLDEADLVDGMLELRDTEGRRLFTLERVAMARYGAAKAGDVARVAKVHKLRLLPEILRGPVNDGLVPLRVAFLVARIADPTDREKAGGEVLKDPYAYGEDRPMTVKRAMEHIGKHYQVSLKGWKLVDRLDLLTEDQKLAMGFTGAAGEDADGTCLRCPFLAKNSPLFHDSLASGSKKGSGESGVDPMTCTRAGCHRTKLENAWRLQAAEFGKEHGVSPDNLVSLEESQKRRWEFARLENKPSGRELGNWDKAEDSRLPTWEKILKGSGAELKVAADDNGKPVLVCEPEVAITVGKSKLPDLFAFAKLPSEKSLTKADLKDLQAKQKKGDLTDAERQQLEQLEAQEEKERVQRLKDEMTRAVEAETKTDCLKELLEKLTSQGPGLAGAHAMVLAACREHGLDFLAFLTGRTEEDLEKDCDRYDIEDGLEKHLKDRTVNELIAIAAVASVWEDVHFSGADRASDFQAMCKAVKLDTKEVYERVKRAHKLAFTAGEQARRDALKADGKKPSPNSCDPVKVDPEHEASKAAAADARAKDVHRYTCEANLDTMTDDVLRHIPVPHSAANENGCYAKPVSFVCELGPKVMFAILLARSAGGQYAWAYEYSLGDASGGRLPWDSDGVATREEAVLAACGVLQEKFVGREIKKSFRAEWESARRMIEAIEKAADARVGDDRVTDVLPAGGASDLIDYDQVDLDAAVKAVLVDKAQGLKQHLGEKPNRADADRLKRWDALRNKILRKAGLK